VPRPRCLAPAGGAEGVALEVAGPNASRKASWGALWSARSSRLSVSALQPRIEMPRTTALLLAAARHDRPQCSPSPRRALRRPWRPGWTKWRLGESWRLAVRPARHPPKRHAPRPLDFAFAGGVEGAPLKVAGPIAARKPLWGALWSALEPVVRVRAPAEDRNPANDGAFSCSRGARSSTESSEPPSRAETRRGTAPRSKKSRSVPSSRPSTVPRRRNKSRLCRRRRGWPRCLHGEARAQLRGGTIRMQPLWASRRPRRRSK
jgi:hypothetical protein